MQDYSHPAIGAALSAAATLLGTELVFVSSIDDDVFTFARLQGRWPGLSDGDSVPLADTMCGRMLDGAPPATADAARDGAYRDTPLREKLGITSYVGVPVRDGDGRLVGTLCGMDRRHVPVDGVALSVLRHLARIVAAEHRSPAAPVVGTIVRTAKGWRVGDAETDDLTTAMVLADLFAPELPPSARPEKADGKTDELTKLQVAVRQLEHALTARIVIEQGIGVLAERLGVKPREAFEQLRRSARGHGRRVHAVAGDVVRSATDPDTPLPPELRRR